MVYRLQDVYDYELPPIPSKEDILFSDLPKEEQYWRRIEMDFTPVSQGQKYDIATKIAAWTDDKKMDFVKRELSRFKFGIWIMNNGVETYLTGSNYRFLQYWLIPTEIGMDHAQHRRYQREFFYFLDLIHKDKYCEGGAVSKPRRVGVTSTFNCDVHNLATIYTDKKFSIQNKTRSDAIDVNYEPVRLNIDRFPSVKLSNGKEIFRPQIDKLLTAKALFVRDQKKRKDDDVDDSSNNHIYVVSTVENADDGKGTFRLIRDEVSKYDASIDISNMFKILRPTAKVGSSQVGKICLFGTSAEKSTENFERWKIIYYNSDYTNRIKRKTTSGLYKYFISGKYSIEGTVLNDKDEEVPLFDIYGECKEDLAIEWIEDQRRPFRLSADLDGLQAVMREYPIYETDAFDSSNSSACFDNFRLGVQLYEIEKREKKVLSGLELPFYTIGNFKWVKDKIDREVVFEPDPYGHWWIYDLPREQWKNKNYIDRYNFLCPDDTSPYLWTCDPFAYREMVAGGSKGAIVIGSSIDSSLGDMGGKICARYNHRPNNPNDFLDEVRKGIILYAAKGLAENNKEWVAMDLLAGKDDKNNNRFRYGRFMLVYENGKFRMWRPGDKIAGISNQQKSIEAYTRDCATYLKEPKNETEFDYLKTVWDKEMIKQWMIFNPLDTTKTDLAVTGAMYTMVLKNFNRIVQQDNSRLSESQIIRAWFGVKGDKLNGKIDPKLTLVDQS